MEGLNQKRLDKMITVIDDWHPCFEDKKIRVSIFISINKKLGYSFVRMCAWGKDDYGLEMDYEDNDINQLYKKYNEWKVDIYDKATDGINKDWFLTKGFCKV